MSAGRLVNQALITDFPQLKPLHEELLAAWKAAETLRFDDPFAGRGMIRLGKALVAFHLAVKGLAGVMDGPDFSSVRTVVERYGRVWAKDDDYYAAAEVLGIDEPPEFAPERGRR
jgi:hypothetical protein